MVLPDARIGLARSDRQLHLKSSPSQSSLVGLASYTDDLGFPDADIAHADDVSTLLRRSAPPAIRRHSPPVTLSHISGPETIA